MDTDRFAAALYIEAHDFEAALSHCAPTDTQLHDAIIMAQAVSEFGRGEHVRAAVLYAKTRVPVEQAALKFHDAGLIRALRHYLSDIVDRVDDANASQLTLLCAWLTQIYVSDTDMAGDVDNSDVDAKEAAAEFWAFIADKQRLGCLDQATTYRLLAAHPDGSSLLLKYATLCKDWPRVVALHLERGDAAAAIGVLVRVLDEGALPPGSQLERVVEAHACQMMEAAPSASVDVWLRLPTLEPVRLFPALTHYHKHTWQAGTPHEGIRFLSALSAESSSASQELLVYFRAQADDDTTLRRFLLAAPPPPSALRVCRDHGRHDAASWLLLHSRGIEEAVDYAMDRSMPGVARQMLEEAQAQMDDSLSRRLWLRVLAGDSEKMTVHEVMQVMTAAKAVPLDALLPRLDDFTALSDLKELCIHELSSSSAVSAQLRTVLDQGVKRSAQLSVEIGKLRSRADTVPDGAICYKCARILRSTDAACFPCGHAFHNRCLGILCSAACCPLCTLAPETVDLPFHL